MVQPRLAPSPTPRKGHLQAQLSESRRKSRLRSSSQHCKNNGGPYKSHNTKECRKYDKDSKAVAAAGKKPYKKKPYKKDGGGSDKQMAYLSEAIESLVRKGLKKAVKKHHKKGSRDDSSSSSDSE